MECIVGIGTAFAVLGHSSMRVGWSIYMISIGMRGVVSAFNQAHRDEFVNLRHKRRHCVQHVWTYDSCYKYFEFGDSGAVHIGTRQPDQGNCVQEDSSVSFKESVLEDEVGAV